MNKPHQRIGSKSNAHVGRDFEIEAQRFFINEGLELVPNIKVPVGVLVQRKFAPMLARQLTGGCLY